MKFAPGNAGRPKGAAKAITRKYFAQIMRELLDEEAINTLTAVLRGRNYVARMKALQFIAEYGIGKPLDVHAVGVGSLDPESPEGILLSLAHQSLPGAQIDDDDEESPRLLSS